MKNLKENFETILQILIFLVGLTILLVLLSHVQQVNLGEFVSSLITTPYIFNPNTIHSADIGQNKINIYWYGLALFCLILSLIFRYLLFKPKTEKTKRKPSIVLCIGLCLFLSVLSLQFVKITKIFQGEYKAFHGLQEEQKKFSLYKQYHPLMGHSYQFAQNCTKHLPGQHYGQLISPLDVRRDRDLTFYTILAYYLYPIDIKVDKKHPRDCFIVFLEKNPRLKLPEGAKVIFTYNQSSLLAIKE